MNRRILVGVLTGLIVPYLATLAWTGTIHGEELRHEQQAGAAGERRILLDLSLIHIWARRSMTPTPAGFCPGSG